MNDIAWRHVLVPLDGSRLAAAALDYVLPMVRAMDGKITLLTVAEPIADGHFVKYAADEQLSITDAIRNYLDHEAGIVAGAGVEVDTCVVTARGTPVGTAIAEAAVDQGADVIAMSTHARHGVSRFVLGCVASDVLKETVVPLMFVPRRAISSADENEGAAALTATG